MRLLAFDLLNRMAQSVLGKRPGIVRQSADDLPFETLVNRQGAIIVAEHVRSESESQLCWSRTTVTPFQTGGAVVMQIKTGVEWSGATGVDHLDDASFRCAPADIVSVTSRRRLHE